MNKLKRTLTRTGIALGLCLGAGAVLTACDNDDENITPVDQDRAYVSLYQASPDAPDLRIEVDNRQINSYPFEYTENTGYLRFFTGERNLKFGPFDASNVVTDTTVDLENGKAYSIFLTDEYPDVQPLILEDNAEDPGSGNAMIRFLNLSPDAPAVDLTAAELDDPIFEEQAFRQESAFQEIPADGYDLSFTASGTQESILEIPDADLQAGWYYTVIVRGYSSPPAGNQHELSAEILVN